MSKDWINVAVVGLGKIYKDSHSKAYTNPASVNNVVIGLCDIRQDFIDEQVEWLKKGYERALKRAEKKCNNQIERLKYGLDNLQGFTDYTTMLDALEGNELDLIDNCTPGRLHVPFAVQAMEHGYHAMSEKPPGLNWWDAKRLVAAEKATSKCFQINANRCYERVVQAMREIMAKGILGEIKGIDVQYGHGGPYLPYHFGESGLPHFIDPLWSGGGCIQDLAPHGISKAIYPLGDSYKLVSCSTAILERRKNPRVMSMKSFTSPVDDWAQATLMIANQKTGGTFPMKVTTSWCGGFPTELSIKAENGELVIGKDKLKPDYVPVVYGEDGKPSYYPVPKDTWEPHESHVREIQIFCDNLLQNMASNTPAEYALRLQEMLSIQYFAKLFGREATLDEMEEWGAEIAADASCEQDAIDQITLKLIKAIDLKS